MSAPLSVEQLTLIANTGLLSPMNPAAPSAVPAALYDVPALLTKLPNWIVWRLETVNGRLTKVPYIAETNWTRHASSTNPATWTDFRTAANGAVLSDSQGVGFVVHGTAVEQQIVGFDLDGCRDTATGELSAWAQELVNLLDSYTEITPSKTGVRIWVRGKLPAGTRVFNLSQEVGYGDKVKIEIYDSARYFTVTGEVFDSFFISTEIELRNLAEAYECCRSIQAKYGAIKQAQQTAEPESRPGVQIERTGTVLTSKRELLMHGTIVSDKPFIVKDGSGNSLEYPSHSEADLALCTALAQEGLNADQIDEQFRQSVLCGPDRIAKWERLSEKTIDKAIQTAGRIKADEPKKEESVLVAPTILTATKNDQPLPDEEEIPPFDPSVVNGIYKEFVDVVTRGTTLAPQFAYVIAKTIVGIRMAGRVKFDLLDAEPRLYTTLIGETGSGKGEAWRRTLSILQPKSGAVGDCGFKIINSADSGVGIKDFFFEPPNQPIVCYVDEVASLGNKASENRNPGIVDTMIELADSTNISRVLAKRKGGGSKTKSDARFAMVLCGQDGDVYMKAFAGRTKLGWWDRY